MKSIRFSRRRAWKAIISLIAALIVIYGANSLERFTSNPARGTPVRADNQPAATISKEPSPTPKAPETAVVAAVIDGDTIRLNTGHTVRYIGINTPESTIRKECFGKEAAEENKRLVESKTVRLERDRSETDRYGRLLRYVYVDDIFVNEQLARGGFAESRAYPPDTAKQDVLAAAEQEAREAGRGMWSACPNR